MKNEKSQKFGTMLTHSGTNPRAHKGVVNPPVYHASTITFESYQHLIGNKPVEYHYGRRGTDGDRYLRNSINYLENAAESLLAPSGLLAINLVLLTFAQKGAHILITDNCYAPVRHFADAVLQKMGIEISYFDPMNIEHFKKQIQKNTKLVWLESPGTMTFEVCDLPKIVDFCKNKKIKTGIDNTWSGGYFLKPLDFGVDYSCQAGTKYIVGHSDVMLGTIACKTMADYDAVFATYYALGSSVAPDDIYLAHRGLRTMEVRMNHQEKSALTIANFLKKHPKVSKVYHPALSDCVGHEFWERDFTGSSGLFSFILKDSLNETQMGKVLDEMAYFAMGYSWGGYESLMIPARFIRSHSPNHENWHEKGQMFRVNIGLEATEDLITDLDKALSRY